MHLKSHQCCDPRVAMSRAVITAVAQTKLMMSEPSAECELYRRVAVPRLMRKPDRRTGLNDLRSELLRFRTCKLFNHVHMVEDSLGLT